MGPEPHFDDDSSATTTNETTKSSVALATMAVLQPTVGYAIGPDPRFFGIPGETAAN